MRVERYFKCVIGGIANESGFVRFHEEESLKAVHQPGAETFIDALLMQEKPVAVHGGFERIVRGGDEVAEKSSGNPGIVPVMSAKRVGQFLAVEADLPGKHAVRVERTTSVFRDSSGVRTRQLRERERPIVIQRDETLGLLGRSPRLGLQGIGDMLNQESAIGLEERQHLIRQCVYCLVYDHSLCVFSPAE